MAGRKKCKRAAHEVVEDLAELAGRMNMPEGALDDELWDTIETEAREKHSKICDAVVLEQLEFLHAAGYSLARLRELIEDACES